ncbi:MAG: hypothetical protein UY23_C0001G0187 [Candidatus Jorgensenbacteria bacterium GW2011_GWA1_48_11]|uniref:Uncharacterized protein n=1 Tax=Candidatus Jorgensenbacteria bacterium GW2011_GWA1_48_11 TaxID=1618660 RepID=A0A0G1UBP0_9BACT|nr:MAG: hypothetical protein UY23_C0001G0187 [Candidatus Jorgensenbacteria bacterium GW2011_GWA1_48_11]KKW12074.1 MAG: hypothetical protein UY51_C0005G0316 [Candidatus Jorgensenbacteria bacterium GW2011_GWB1_49_9]
MAKKLIVVITLLTVVANGLVMPPRAAAATSALEACAGSIGSGILSLLGGRGLSALSGTVPTSDAGAQTQIAAGRVQSCVQVVTEQLAQLALATLKRRVLDVMVDETINWINGGGSPQFVTNFNDFINSAGQAAAGDVIRGVGLGQMCQGLRMPVIQFLTGGRAAGAPPFSQQITCTLDQVVNNINDFYNNFQSGGWIAFNESWRPQNNYYGAILIAGDELISKTLESERAAQTSAIAGQGYSPTQRCLEWTLWGDQGDAGGTIIATADGSTFGDPRIPPPVPDNVSPDDYLNVYWYCSQITNTTPGSTLAGVTQRALTAHVDNVINAQTFADYAEALVGAAINRLVQESVSGLLGVATPSAPHQGYVDLSQEGSRPDDLLGGAGTSYTGAVRDSQDAPSGSNLSTQLTLAQTSLSQAAENIRNASSTNGEIKTLLTSFKNWCDVNGGSTSHPQSCSGLADELTAANNLSADLNEKYTEVLPLLDQVAAFLAQLQANTPLPADFNNSVNTLLNQIIAFADNAYNTALNLPTQRDSIQASYNACLSGSTACN